MQLLNLTMDSLEKYAIWIIITLLSWAVNAMQLITLKPQEKRLKDSGDCVMAPWGHAQSQTLYLLVTKLWRKRQLMNFWLKVCI